jgi:hypothetical protein
MQLGENINPPGNNTGDRILTRRKKNVDGSVTVTTKVIKSKPDRKNIVRGTGEKTIGAVMTGQLQPFKRVMKRQLNKRGINANSLPFKTIIPLYYNEFVRSEQNNYNTVDLAKFKNNPVFRIKYSDKLNGSLTTDHFDYVGEIKESINEVVQFFANALARKNAIIANGENPKEVLNEEELTQAKAAQQVLNNLESLAAGSKPITFKTLKNIFLTVIIGYLIYQIVFK